MLMAVDFDYRFIYVNIRSFDKDCYSIISKRCYLRKAIENNTIDYRKQRVYLDWEITFYHIFWFEIKHLLYILIY